MTDDPIKIKSKKKFVFFFFQFINLFIFLNIILSNVIYNENKLNRKTNKALLVGFFVQRQF